MRSGADDRCATSVSPHLIESSTTSGAASPSAAASPAKWPATFAVPHDRLGEDVAAAVVLRDGMDATSEELRDFAAGCLAAFKVPRTILILDEILAVGDPGFQHKCLNRLSEFQAAGTTILFVSHAAFWRAGRNPETKSP